MTRQIGIYPGTFDPIHHGHIAFAQEAVSSLGLDNVVFLAEPTPRGKECTSTLTDRTNHVRDAIARLPTLSTMTVGSDRFTVSETLPEIKAAFPDARLAFLIGSDVLFGLQHWDNLKSLLESAHIVIGLRSDCTKDIVDKEIVTIEKLFDIHVNYTVIETSHRHVSSTQIKRLSGVI